MVFEKSILSKKDCVRVLSWYTLRPNVSYWIRDETFHVYTQSYWSFIYGLSSKFPLFFGQSPVHQSKLLYTWTRNHLCILCEYIGKFMQCTMFKGAILYKKIKWKHIPVNKHRVTYTKPWQGMKSYFEINKIWTSEE